jgi:hypothetical protein
MSSPGKINHRRKLSLDITNERPEKKSRSAVMMEKVAQLAEIGLAKHCLGDYHTAE